MLSDSNSIASPLVSIIIPCFNSEEYIAECINSIQSQDYNDIEIIVIDDGSTDNSLDIINSYQNINIYIQKNSGACIARNLGLSKSQGKYIKFLDSDDFLEPHVISKQVRLAEELAENRIVFGDYFLLKGNQKYYENTSLRESNQTSSLILGDILTSTPLHRKWMLEKIGGFDERFKNGQEWNLHVRLSSEGFIFHHQEIPIYNYRIHQSVYRISVARAYDKERHLYEAIKLDMTREKLDHSCSDEIKAAFAAKYWLTARHLYQSGDRQHFKDLMKKSKDLTKEYRRYWDVKYNTIYKILGFHNAERVYKMYSFLKNKKTSKYV